MDRVVKINQAYSITPWRKQLQAIGLFLLVLVIFALIAGVYLNVNAKAATIGRQIQNHRNQIEDLGMEIANQQSQLAMLTSSAVMENRAVDLGFRQAQSEEIVYLVVDEYAGRSPAVLASETRAFTAPASQPQISPAFTQSLLDWIRKELILSPNLRRGIVP
jgi:hypothetical protein